QQDRVLYFNTNQGNQPNYCYERKGITGCQQHEHRANNTQRNYRQHNQGATKCFKLQYQGAQYTKNSYQYNGTQTAKTFLAGFYITGSYIVRIGRKMHGIQLFYESLCYFSGIVPALHKSGGYRKPVFIVVFNGNRRCFKANIGQLT